MKRHLLIIAASALVFPVFAMETNNAPYPPRVKKYDAPGRKDGDKLRQDRKRGENGFRKGDRSEWHREMSPEEKAMRQERRLKLMEKTLKEIGVTEEQREKISALQKKLRDDMKKASKAASEARRKLSQLEKDNAPVENIYAAIDAVSDTQAEQMKILVRNKIQMERILGSEKYRQFMEAARKSYRKHGGRHSGTGLPPRPGMPPLPPNNSEKLPPIPETSGHTEQPPKPPA